MRTGRLVGFFFVSVAAFAQTSPQAARADVKDSAPAVPHQTAEPIAPEARGDIFMARKMYREAAETYLTIKPPTAVVFNKAGIAYHQMADLDTAKRYYERAVKLNHDYAEAINNIGTVYYSRKSYRRAISSYKKALKYSPESASIYSNLGTAYFARKDYNQAIDCYNKAVSLDPDVFEHRSTQGVLLQERSVEERAKFHYFLARMYAKSGRTELALQYIRKSLEEGFKEKKKYMEEQEFAEIRKLPEFDLLMKMEPRVL